MLIGPTLTLIRPLIRSPSTESRVVPGMQGATLSTSSSTSQARFFGTGTVNECSSSISLSSRCRCQCSSGQYLREVAPVGGRPMQVCRVFGELHVTISPAGSELAHPYPNNHVDYGGR